MSEPLPPAAMAAVTTASGLASGGITPRAVRHFGLAAMEARAGRPAANDPPSRPVLAPVIPAPPPPAVPVHQVKVRLWLPLTILFLLLSPFALLLALFAYLMPPRWRPDPILAALAIGRTLLALGGTIIDVDTPDAIVRIKIY